MMYLPYIPYSYGFEFLHTAPVKKNTVYDRDSKFLNRIQLGTPHSQFVNKRNFFNNHSINSFHSGLSKINRSSGIKPNNDINKNYNSFDNNLGEVLRVQFPLDESKYTTIENKCRPTKASKTFIIILVERLLNISLGLSQRSPQQKHSTNTIE